MKKPRLRHQPVGCDPREVKQSVNKEIVSIVKLAVSEEGINA